MARNLRYLFVLLLMGLSGIVHGQSAPGEIRGKVVDEKGEPVINATIRVTQGGIPKNGTITDIDGNYVIKPLDAGSNYTVTFSYLGYMEYKVNNVVVSADQTTPLDAKLTPAKAINALGKDTAEVQVIGYRVPLVNPYENKNVIDSKDLERLPTRNTNDIIATQPGIYQQTSGGSIYAQGGRADANSYVIDGVTVLGSATNLPQNMIDQIEVNISGVSAKYGDALGAIPVITTKGPSSQLQGSVLLQHSVDGYNNNLVNFFISGPLYKQSVTDTATHTTYKRPVVGFVLGGDFYDDHDRYPSYLGLYQVKPNVLSQLSQNPLTITTNTSGQQIYRYSAEYLQPDQVNHLYTYPNAEILEARLDGKLVVALDKSGDMNLTAGGRFNYTNQKTGSYVLDVFDPSGAYNSINYTGAGYLRFTQRFGKPATAGEKPSAISNAYYQLQADYEVNNSSYEDPRFKHNIFDYGYVGKFNQNYTPYYIPGSVDTTSGLKGVVYQGQALTGLTFQRSDLNPTLANYTSEYYNTTNTPPTSETDVRSHNALLNGDYPANAYGLFPNVGANLNGYGFGNQVQYSFNADASFDLLLGKVKHAIEFGLYYQQRVERGYALNAEYGSTISIWQQMRQLVNTQVVLDTKHPIFIVGGKKYTYDQVKSGLVNPGPADTIFYNYDTIGGKQTYFDYNLRKKLGMDPGGTNQINVDALDPNTFSLNMFSADELLNQGNSYVSYYGYNYLGDRQNGQVNFSDFFTQKDAYGNYTRPIGAFSPNYTAGYILDKFQIKDLNFNIGLRIDRYDDGEQELIDPYSLYPERTVSQLSATTHQFISGNAAPSNIGGNYVVYVDDNTSSNPTVIGYRNGDTWYDPSGKVIQDPSVLKQYSGGRDPQPFLVNKFENIQDSSFKPGESFKNYTPQVNVMPRIQFNFPITDVALLYGHYDVYVQRPTTGVFATPLQYYFIQQNSNAIINNPDLRPQKLFDYEVGFKQVLSKESAISISAFYKERKDMIQLRPYLYAYPTTYYTYGNRDFSTTKGMTVKYDLRRIGNLRMQISYTLQFAEGTGSDAASTNAGSTTQIQPYGLLQSLIVAGLPNLRYVTALDQDSRHNIVVNLDYRYDHGEGPMIGDSHFLEDAGLNLLFKARSGEPYTRLIDPVSNQIDGAVNGSRYPWHYDVDLRIDKTFMVTLGSRKHQMEAGLKPKRQLGINVFAYSQNLFNIKDILYVYGYTGRPNDNGYLTSPQGQALIPNQTNPASYMYLYQLYYNSPGDYNLPRQIFIGAQFQF